MTIRVSDDQEVDFVRTDDRVELGRRQAEALDDGAHLDLELAVGRLRIDAPSVERCSQCRNSRAASLGVANECRPDRS